MSRRNFLFEEIQPICTAISLSSDDIDVVDDESFEARQKFITEQVDKYIHDEVSKGKGVVYNAVKKYGGWVRSKMIKAAKAGLKLEYV